MPAWWHSAPPGQVPGAEATVDTTVIRDTASHGVVVDAEPSEGADERVISDGIGVAGASRDGEPFDLGPEPVIDRGEPVGAQTQRRRAGQLKRTGKAGLNPGKVRV